MTYDYTVLAGTQGMRNHQKKDRLFELAERSGAAGRPIRRGRGRTAGRVDWPHVAGLDCMAFYLFARLSGLVPLVGITSGRCFAGNAALLGCCDVVIATAGSNIGMGGPAMIEGGGLGVSNRGRSVRWTCRSRTAWSTCVADEPAAWPAVTWPTSENRTEPPTAPKDPDGSGGHPRQPLRAYDVRTSSTPCSTTCSSSRGVRARHGHGPGADRKAVPSGSSPTTHAPRRRDRRRGRRQGGPVHAAVRRVRGAPAPVVRHARDHGRAGRGADRDGASRQPAVHHRSQPDRPDVHGRAPQGLRPRRPGHGRRQLPRPVLHGRLADRRARRHGVGGGGAARDAPRAGRGR